MSPRSASPDSTSSRRRSARKRASAITFGGDALGCGSRSMSSVSQRRASFALPSSRVSRSSTAPGPSSGTRPAVSSEKPSSSAPPTALMAASTAGRERKLPRSGSTSRSRAAWAARRSRAKHLEVGVAEAVDRLVLVADLEHPGLGTAQHLDELELHGVGVLKLVDHDMVEALAPDRRQGRAVLQECERAQLEVEEVERRALLLELLVARVKGLEQALERPARRSRGVDLGGVRLDRLGVRLGGGDRVADLGQVGVGHALAAQPLVAGDASSTPTATARYAAAARATSSSPSASSASSASRNARSRRRPASVGVEHPERGSSPAASGCEASSRRQKAWIVITQARSVARAMASSSSPRPGSPASRAARERRVSSWRIRVRISAEARSVNVNASRRSTSTPSSITDAQ